MEIFNYLRNNKPIKTLGVLTSGLLIYGCLNARKVYAQNVNHELDIDCDCGNLRINLYQSALEFYLFSIKSKNDCKKSIYSHFERIKKKQDPNTSIKDKLEGNLEAMGYLMKAIDNCIISFNKMNNVRNIEMQMNDCGCDF